jgi:hypothetical protein
LAYKQRPCFCPLIEGQELEKRKKYIRKNQTRFNQFINNQLTTIFLKNLRVSVVIYLPRKQLRLALLTAKDMEKQKQRALCAELF